MKQHLARGVVAGVMLALMAGPGVLAAPQRKPKTATSEGQEVTTPSGLRYVDLTVGKGPMPKAGQRVRVHYTGTLADGKKFDSSLDRNEPLVFVVGMGQVIKGWDEGLLTMHVGGKRRLIIPPQLGYGDDGVGTLIPPKAELHFEIDLLAID